MCPPLARALPRCERPEDDGQWSDQYRQQPQDRDEAPSEGDDADDQCRGCEEVPLGTSAAVAGYGRRGRVVAVWPAGGAFVAVPFVAVLSVPPSQAERVVN